MVVTKDECNDEVYNNDLYVQLLNINKISSLSKNDVEIIINTIKKTLID